MSSERTQDEELTKDYKHWRNK